MGDIVDVKGYGRAEVIEPLCTDEGSQFHGRYRVRYQQNGATYYARSDVLRRTATQVGRLHGDGRGGGGFGARRAPGVPARGAVAERCRS